MGGSYFVLGKNFKDICWQKDLYTDNVFKFFFVLIYCWCKYEIVDVGKRKERKQNG